MVSANKPPKEDSSEYILHALTQHNKWEDSMSMSIIPSISKSTEQDIKMSANDREDSYDSTTSSSDTEDQSEQSDVDHCIPIPTSDIHSQKDTQRGVAKEETDNETSDVTQDTGESESGTESESGGESESESDEDAKQEEADQSDDRQELLPFSEYHRPPESSESESSSDDGDDEEDDDEDDVEEAEKYNKKNKADEKQYVKMSPMIETLAFGKGLEAKKPHTSLKTDKQLEQEAKKANSVQQTLVNQALEKSVNDKVKSRKQTERERVTLEERTKYRDPIPMQTDETEWFAKRQNYEENPDSDFEDPAMKKKATATETEGKKTKKLKKKKPKETETADKECNMQKDKAAFIKSVTGENSATTEQ